MSTIDTVGWALLHSLWQGALVAALLWCLRRVLANRSANLRYLVSVAALVSLPVLFTVTAIRELGVVPATVENAASPTAAPVPTGETAQPSGGSATQHVIVLDPVATGSQPAAPIVSARGRTVQEWITVAIIALQPAMPWIVAAWIAGVLLFAARLLGGWRAAQRLARQGVSPVAEQWHATLNRLSQRLGIRRSVTILESTLIMVPAVVGWLRPVVLVPASAFTGLTPQQLEVLLAHELAHVRRHDYFVNVMQAVVEAFLFYHPATWWISARIREDREFCCDDLAVAVSGNARLYAEALVGMEELRARNLGLALAASDGSLLTRVTRLLQPEVSNTELVPRWVAGAAVATMVVLAAAGVGLANAAPVAEFSAEPETMHVTPNDEAAYDASLMQDKKKTKPEEVAAKDTLPIAPDTVILHTDASVALAERVSWAHGQAERAGKKRYWVAYAIAPLAWLDGKAVYVRRFTRFEGIKGVTLMGRVTNVGDMEHTSLRGVPMQPLVGGDGGDVAVLLAFDRGESAPVAVQASTIALPVDFEGRSLLWLGRGDDQPSVAVLKELFRRSKKAEMREDLTAAIGLHRTSAVVVPELVRILSSSEPDDVRDEAAEWLGHHPDQNALNALAKAARGDRSLDVRREAAESVGLIRLPAAADTLIALVQTLEHPDVRVEAVESLGERTEPKAVEALVRAARSDRDERVQEEAVETLGDVPNRGGVPALLELARSHPSPQMRSEAMETIGEAAPPATAVEALLRATREDRSVQVQREAVESLGDIPDAAGLPALREILKSQASDEVREEAVETVGHTASAQEAFEILKEIIRSDRSVNVQREAVETLTEIKDPRAHELLLETAERHPQAEVQQEAIEELQNQGARPEAIEVLSRVARTGTSENAAREAVETLGEMKDPRSLSVVADVARKHPVESVRMEAIESYGEYAAPADAVSLFRELLRSEQSRGAQDEIMESLAELSGGQGVPILVDIARNHPNADLRSAALHELSEISDPRAREVVAQLLRK